MHSLRTLVSSLPLIVFLVSPSARATEIDNISDFLSEKNETAIEGPYEYIPESIVNLFQDTSYINVLTAATFAATASYGVYLTIPTLVDTATFLYQLNIFLHEGYATTYKDYIEEGDWSHMTPIETLRTLNELEKIVIVGIIKERIGIHPTFQGKFAYYTTIVFLSNAFNLSWQAVSSAGDVSKMAELFK